MKVHSIFLRFGFLKREGNKAEVAIESAQVVEVKPNEVRRISYYIGQFVGPDGCVSREVHSDNFKEIGSFYTP